LADTTTISPRGQNLLRWVPLAGLTLTVASLGLGYLVATITWGAGLENSIRGVSEQIIELRNSISSVAAAQVADRAQTIAVSIRVTAVERDTENFRNLNAAFARTMERTEDKIDQLRTLLISRDRASIEQP
jgi:hypothetical protein